MHINLLTGSERNYQNRVSSHKTYNTFFSSIIFVSLPNYSGTVSWNDFTQRFRFVSIYRFFLTGDIQAGV